MMLPSAVEPDRDCRRGYRILAQRWQFDLAQFRGLAAAVAMVSERLPSLVLILNCVRGARDCAASRAGRTSEYSARRCSSLSYAVGAQSRWLDGGGADRNDAVDHQLRADPDGCQAVAACRKEGRHMIRRPGFAAAFVALAACGSGRTVDPARQVGPDPLLPAPYEALLPDIRVPKPVGWQPGEAPSVPAGFRVQALATGLKSPRSVRARHGDSASSRPEAEWRADRAE